MGRPEPTVGSVMNSQCISNLQTAREHSQQMQSLALLLHRPGEGLPLQPVPPQGKEQTRKERDED